MIYTPKVSIITPTYNHQDTIRQCIDSVLKQTYNNWEMIIIDDSSTDNTQNIIKHYLQKDRRIKAVFHKSNYGPYRLVDTYNEALQLATGELIAILEGDDWWSPLKLEKQVKLLKDPKIVLCYGSAAEVTDTGKVITYRKIILNKVNRNYLLNRPPGKIIEKLLYLYNPIISCTVIIKKSILYKIGGFKSYKNLPLVDFPTYCYLSLEGEFAIIENDVLGFWRRHKNSISFNKDIIIYKNDIKFLKEFIKTNKHRFNKQLVKLINITEEQLDDLYEGLLKNIKNQYYISHAKYYIYFNDWRLAKNNFKKALKYSTHPMYKLVALLGYIASIFKIDILEPFIKIRRNIKKYCQ